MTEKKKLKGGDILSFRLPIKTDSKILDFLNENRVNRSKKVLEAVLYYVENKEIIDNIKTNLEDILNEISSNKADIQPNKNISKSNIDNKTKLMISIKNADRKSVV